MKTFRVSKQAESLDEQASGYFKEFAGKQKTLITVEIPLYNEFSVFKYMKPTLLPATLRDFDVPKLCLITAGQVTKNTTYKKYFLPIYFTSR